MSNNQNISDYKSEIQVAISTLVASLGFYKVQELTDFIHTIKNVNGIPINSDFTVVLFPFIGMLLYLAYLFCVAFSLYCIFKHLNPKKHQMSILFAVTCYFTLQILMIGLTLSEPIKATKFEKQEPKKVIMIKMDSLNVYVPYDSIATTAVQDL